MRSYRRRLWLVPVAISVVVAFAGMSAGARGQRPPQTTDPHGNFGAPTQNCASCHSVHISPSGTSLLGASPPEDVCYSCHDGTVGANVKAEFHATGSTHPIAPGQLSCDSCHTPHKPPAESTALLRLTIDGSFVYSPPDPLGTPLGDDFCLSCHGPASPGGDLSPAENGVHITSPQVPFPASGSRIKCLACHEPHGSGSDSLQLDGSEGEALCFSCHVQGSPQTSGDSDPQQAFSARANDITTSDGNGIRIYHHPVSSAEQAGGARQVECSSCHNPHVAQAQESQTGSKIADPARPLAMDSAWIPGWDETSGYMNRASNVTAYCTKCHVSPTNTSPIPAGAWIPVDVRLVNDDSYDADGRRHDKFVASTWTSSRHGNPNLNPASLSYRGCANRGLTGAACVVTCTACHDFHGTSNAYMLRETLDAPDTNATYTMTGFTALDTASDRLKLQGFCLTCHPERGTSHNATKLCTQCHYHDSNRL